MNNKKIKLTESELKQVVESAVKKILVKEGFGDWASDKFDNAFRGYKVREGNPQSVLDVIKGNGWTYNKEVPFDPTTNTIKVQKATGAFGGHYGLSIEKLIEDINLFLNGKGRASYAGKDNGNVEIISINAPINLIKGSGLNESFEMGGDMVKFYLNSPMNGRQVVTVPFEEFANAQYKNDYLWEKAAEQGNIKLMRNGYFEVDPNDPHKAEVDRIF